MPVLLNDTKLVQEDKENTDWTDKTDGEDVESLTASKKYQEGVKKVGPGCKFYYRCIFDPVPNSDLKDPAKYGVESVSDDQQS